MIDALLYAVRDGIRAAGMGYDYASCEIMDSGEPPPRCGNFFVSIHGGRSSPGDANERNLYELFGFSVTLTMRVVVPLDRLGDQQISRNVVIEQARRNGFHAKVEQLRAYLHSNWAITVQVNQNPNSANDNLTAWLTGTVYGFIEPARWNGMEQARLVGGEWFGADPESTEMGVACEMKFDRAKRIQPQTMAVGVFA